MAGIQDILSALQNGVVAVNNLTTALNKIFPQTTATSSTAPSGGTITFASSEAKIFLTVTTSSGGTYKVPGY
jgi:hypothetical protein